MFFPKNSVDNSVDKSTSGFSLKTFKNMYSSAENDALL